MKSNQIKLIGFICASGLLCACTNETVISEEIHSSQVELTSVGVTTGANDQQLENAPDGNYYFGCTNKEGAFNYTPLKIEGGVINAFTAYWDNIKLNENVTLSNATDNEIQLTDILWGSLKPTAVSKLSFILDHKMAKAKIKLDIPANWTIKTIALTELKTTYSFSNKDGKVEITANAKTVDIPVGVKDNVYSTILPPQEKGSNSTLTVVVNDGSNDRTYSRKLPYAMAQEIAPGQWEDIPLIFRAGYILEISATIPQTANDKILFTYATLKDWQSVGGGTITARPAGVYTVNDWNDFATVYNDTSKQVERQILLGRYGTYNTGTSAWTFTLKRSIDMTGKVITKVQNFTTGDTFNADTNCTITGKTADELGISGNFIK